MTTVADTLTVAIHGTGRMAEIHALALQPLVRDGLDVGGRTVRVDWLLCGRDAEKVKALGTRLGIERATTRYEEVLHDPSVSVVDNCLINAMHHGPLLQAIAAGKHVLCDKPLALSVEEASHLLQMATRAGVKHHIIQDMRYLPGFAKVKDLVEAGTLGRVFHVQIVFGYMVPYSTENRPLWFYRKDLSGGGILLDMMAHFFDLLRYLFGPVRSVYASSATYFPQRHGPDGTPFPVEVEDTASVIVRMRSGILADCFLSWARRKHEEVPQMQVDGEAASVVATFKSCRVQRQGETPLFRFDPTAVQPDPREGWEEMALAPCNPFRLQIESFLRSLVMGTACKPDWEDALMTQRLIDLAYRSIEHRRELDAEFEI